MHQVYREQNGTGKTAGLARLQKCHAQPRQANRHCRLRKVKSASDRKFLHDLCSLQEMTITHRSPFNHRSSLSHRTFFSPFTSLSFTVVSLETYVHYPPSTIPSLPSVIADPRNTAWLFIFKDISYADHHPGLWHAL